MTTIMPMSETTACLPLSLLNDDGYLAFCESDFVAIPSGILMRYISGNPVFLCNPSLPHDGIVTVSHCAAPRRMDGATLDPVRILTHYESDYGAAPKVEMRRGERITVLDPDFAGRRYPIRSSRRSSALRSRRGCSQAFSTAPSTSSSRAR
jgi:hypothetical protein